MTPCEQKDNITHIQEELANHKVWRKETTTQLSTIEVSCATANERLKSVADKLEAGFIASEKDIANKMKAFDDHVKDGSAFRVALIMTMIGLAGVVVAGLVGYGKLEQKVEAAYAHVVDK